MSSERIPVSQEIRDRFIAEFDGSVGSAFEFGARLIGPHYAAAERERVTRIIREQRDKCLAVAAEHHEGESWLAPPWEEKARVYAELLVALRVEDTKSAVNEDGA